MFELVSNTSTEDGRLTKGKKYKGQFVSVGGGRYPSELRFLCWDNTGSWMTFRISVFNPA